MLLHNRPCSWLTRFEFWEYMIGNLELRGNAYAAIVRDESYTPVDIWPATPDNVTISETTGGLMYSINGRIFHSEDVIHLRSQLTYGHYGISPVGALAQSIGLQLSAEEYGARVFDGDGMMRMALTTDQVLRDKETIQDLKRSWREAVGGNRNAHETAILHGGIKPVNIGINPKDAQLLELMKATRQDIIRAYRIPPHKVGELGDATFSNIEHQGYEWKEDSILPRVCRIEAALECKLIRPGTPYFIRFNLDSLGRADFATRMAGYVQAYGNGIMSANEIRALEDLPPYREGDTYFRPLNLAPVDAPLDLPESPDAEPDAVEPEPEDGTRAVSLSEFRAATAKNQDVRDLFIPMMTRDLVRMFYKWEQRMVAGVKQHLNTRADNWDEFVEEFIERAGEESYAVMTQPTIDLARQISKRAAELINGAANPEQMAAFVEQIAQTKSKIAPQWALDQLMKIREKAGTDYVLDEIASGWRRDAAQQAEYIATSTAVETDGDISRLTWRENGITRIRWITSGNACKICQALDGATVGIEQAFAEPGTAIKGGEGQADLQISSNIRYPPLHSGCQCSIGPA
jgi:HK97 family phage portal protein